MTVTREDIIRIAESVLMDLKLEVEEYRSDYTGTDLIRLKYRDRVISEIKLNRSEAGHAYRVRRRHGI